MGSRSMGSNYTLRVRLRSRAMNEKTYSIESIIVFSAIIVAITTLETMLSVHNLRTRIATEHLQLL